MGSMGSGASATDAREPSASNGSSHLRVHRGTDAASTGATMAATAFTPFVRLLSHMPKEQREALLLEIEQILRGVGLSFEELTARRNMRVPHEACIDMLEAAVRISGRPALGLYCAKMAQPGDLELLEYLLRSGSTGADAIEVTRRYLPLVIDAEFEVTREGRWLVGRLRFAPDLRVTRALLDSTVGFILHFTARYLVGPLGPFELQLAHAEPEDAAEYERMLGIKPVFGCPHYAFVFSPELERATVREADPVLFAVLKRTADAELDALPRRRTLTRRVRDAIESTLTQGAPLPLVARMLGYSAPTLRRHLEQQGTSYRILLEQVRRDLAARHLEAMQLTVSEIAYRLGFAHAPAFHRAFKRWYNRSPTEYRQLFEHRASELLRAGRAAP
jgi:AraC-like DNA-binding protein